VFTEAAPTGARTRERKQAQGPAQDRSRGDAGCAAICRRLGEPLTGTAPAAALGWLLVEHPGPWPAFGLPPDLPADLAHYSRGALEHGVRTQLIRRPDRTARQARRPVLMVAGGPMGARWLERRTLGDAGALTDLDPAAFTGARRPGFGSPLEAALLVCTHGRREVCCARYGRPVAQALAERFAPLVWETTHVGGDRFAANLVVLPSGGYYGRLDPADAVRVAQAALDGRIDLDRYRGTAGLPEAAQAAECMLRRALGAAGEAAVRYLGPEAAGADGTKPSQGSGVADAEARAGADTDAHTARFAVGGLGVRVVTLARHETAEPRLTSCGGGTVEAPAAYRLLAITSGG